jgi:lipoyl synthase
MDLQPPNRATAAASEQMPVSASIPRTLPRHPRPLGGDPMRTLDAPLVSLSSMVVNNQQLGDQGGHQLSVKRKPPWLRAKVPGGEGYHRLKTILSEHRLHTVCEEAGCPNMGECWARGVATIMILGDTCTRSCGFCNVKTGRPATLDKDEPRRVAESIRIMYEGAGLKHLVITSVNRDELPDGGAGIWAETIIRTKDACPGMSLEVLIPDFEGNWAALQMVIDARPHIINHNLETVKRMYPAVRPSAKFDRSVELLRRVKEQGLVAKTGIMVGIGERDEEVLALMGEVLEGTKARRHEGAEGSDRHSALGIRHSTPTKAHGARMASQDDLPATNAESPIPNPEPCDILTIGQYLQPTRNHLPIDRWVTPEQFAIFREEGLRRGFKVVESGPMVRSSYHADHQADELTSVSNERAQANRMMMDRLLQRGE